MPDLQSALRPVLPAGVAIGQPDGSGLWPGEDLGPVVARRLAEFTAGREAARAAIRALPAVPRAIPHGPDRAPIWPAGLVGSITHCDGICLAIVADAANWAGLGLDAEPLAPLAPDLWPTLLAKGEQVANGLDALAVFVAKEAAYKAQYALSRQIFDFQTLRLVWRGDGFVATFTRDVPPFGQGTALSGQVVRTAGHLAAVVAIAN